MFVVQIKTELSGEDKDYIPPIPLPEENGDHVLYNPIVTTPCTPGSRKRELDYSPRMVFFTEKIFQLSFFLF